MFLNIHLYSHFVDIENDLEPQTEHAEVTARLEHAEVTATLEHGPSPGRLEEVKES